MATLSGPVRRGAFRALATTAAVLVAAFGAASCGPEGPPPIRVWSDSYEFRITADPSPPRAREVTRYRIVVIDRKTGQFVEGGEGQIFASSADRANRYDSFEPAPEAGTYTARLNYITAGDWRVNVRFRRDSLAPLERPVDDWVQTVRGARPVSERPFTDTPDTASVPAAKGDAPASTAPATTAPASPAPSAPAATQP